MRSSLTNGTATTLGAGLSVPLSVRDGVLEASDEFRGSRRSLARLLGERRRERRAQLPRINVCDRRERSRFVGCRPLNTTTLWKTLRLPECTTRVLVWIPGRSDEELECDGCKRVDIVDTRWRRAREPLRGAVRRSRLRRDSYLDQRLRKPKPRDSSPFTFQNHVAGRHHPVMDACARSKVDCVGKPSCALQDLCNRSNAVLPHHRVHGSTCELCIDEVRDVPFGPEGKRTGQTRVIKRRLTELSERVEQLGLLSELAPLLRQLESYG